jgi:hypothetical protein
MLDVSARLLCLDERRCAYTERVSYDPPMCLFHMHLIKLGTTSKFTEIHKIHMHHLTKFSIIISQLKKHHRLDNNITAIVHWLDNNITKSIGQGGMRNFLIMVIISYNLRQHRIINVKFSFGSDHLAHDECDRSITNVDQRVFVETYFR